MGRQTTKTIVAMNKTMRFNNLLKPHIPSFRFSKLYKRFHNKHYVLFDSHSSCNKRKRFGDVLKKCERSDRKPSFKNNPASRLDKVNRGIKSCCLVCVVVYKITEVRNIKHFLRKI